MKTLKQTNYRILFYEFHENKDCTRFEEKCVNSI